MACASKKGYRRMAPDLHPSLWKRPVDIISKEQRGFIISNHHHQVSEVSDMWTSAKEDFLPIARLSLMTAISMSDPRQLSMVHTAVIDILAGLELSLVKQNLVWLKSVSNSPAEPFFRWKTFCEDEMSVPVIALRISRAASSRISIEACSLYQAACGVQIRFGASFNGPWLKLNEILKQDQMKTKQNKKPQKSLVGRRGYRGKEIYMYTAD